MPKKALLCIIVLAVAVFLCLGAAACTDVDGVCEKDLAEYVRLNAVALFMVTGENEQLHTLFTPRVTGYSVTWECDNEAVATVSDGLVTAVGSGRAQVKVSIDNTKYNAVCEVIVSDIEVSDKFVPGGGNRFRTLDEAIASAQNGQSITVFRGYYSGKGVVDKDLTIIGEQGTALSNLTVEKDKSVSLENITFYTSDENNDAKLTVREGATAILRSCNFVYDYKESLPDSDTTHSKTGSSGGQGKGETPRGAQGKDAFVCEKDFRYVQAQSCRFSGYGRAIQVQPSDGKIILRDNTFSSCGTGIDVDVRREGNENAGLEGVIQSNVFSGIDRPTLFTYNGGLYTGVLKFDDYRPHESAL